MHSTRAVPSRRAWWSRSASWLRQPASSTVSISRRPTWSWNGGGSTRLYSRSTVVLDDGIRRPTGREIIAGGSLGSGQAGALDHRRPFRGVGGDQGGEL